MCSLRGIASDHLHWFRQQLLVLLGLLVPWFCAIAGTESTTPLLVWGRPLGFIEFTGTAVWNFNGDD
jgi:hypothetical protein